MTVTEDLSSSLWRPCLCRPSFPLPSWGFLLGFALKFPGLSLNSGHFLIKLRPNPGFLAPFPEWESKPRPRLPVQAVSTW